MNQKRNRYEIQLNANNFKEEYSIYLNELRGGLSTAKVSQVKICQLTKRWSHLTDILFPQLNGRQNGGNRDW